LLEGKTEEAARLFGEAELVLNRSESGCEIACATISSFYCKYLLDTGDAEKALDRALLTLQWRKANAWQVAVDTTSLLASDLMVLGLIYLELDDLENAYHYLNRQVELFRTANEWLYLPSGLTARAKLHIAKGDHIAAKQDLEEALTIANRTGALLNTWEANLVLALLALQSGQLQEAQSCYQRAMKVEGMESYKQVFEQSEILRLQLYPDVGSDRSSQA